MAKLEWKDAEDGEDATSRAYVGSWRDSANWLLVAKDNCARVFTSMMERSALDRDAAKAAAEQALREMHDALVAHFAPVLQWECDLHSVATLGQWFLQADSEEWSVMACPPGAERAVVVSGSRCTTRENNRRAAENALRALGVTFRVEGE